MQEPVDFRGALVGVAHGKRAGLFFNGFFHCGLSRCNGFCQMLQAAEFVQINLFGRWCAVACPLMSERWSMLKGQGHRLGLVARYPRCVVARFWQRCRSRRHASRFHRALWTKDDSAPIQSRKIGNRYPCRTVGKTVRASPRLPRCRPGLCRSPGGGQMRQCYPHCCQTGWTGVMSVALGYCPSGFSAGLFSGERGVRPSILK